MLWIACFIYMFLMIQICTAQNFTFHQTELMEIWDVRPHYKSAPKEVLGPDWYLSHNGSDTSTCGRNISNACRTLDWLLDRFYQAPYTLNQTLSLVTDTSLIINNNLVQKHYWMRWLNVLASINHLSKANHNVTVEISNVTQLESTWKLQGMNLIINNSFLSKTGFYLSNHKSGISKFVTVTMSTFGLLQAERGFIIQVSNCIFKGDSWKSSTLINVVNSTINITNSIFQDFKAYFSSAVLNASSSRIHLENCQFLTNIGKHGVIQVGKQTDITIYNTMFENNGYWYFAESTVLVNSHSKAVLKNSQCFTNIASTGGCIRSNPGTYLNVQNSTFFNNKGAFGGAIYCEGAFNSQKKVGTYENKNQLQFNKYQTLQDSQCSIKNSIFIGNFALQKGGNTYFNHTTAIIADCQFQLSFSFISGGVMMVYNSKITIDNSNFNETASVFEGGVFDAVDNCNIIIINSVISFSIAMKASSFQIQNGVALSMNNVTVRDGYVRILNLNSGYSFSIIDHCSVLVTNSYFEPIYPFPWVFYMEDNSNLTVMGSRFKTIGNSSTQIVSAAKSSRVNFTKCIFQQCAGFVMLENSYLFIKDSLLAKSQYVVSNALISATGNSKIELDETNITDIIPNVDLPLVRLASSNASINKCLYSGNRLSRHIVATGNSLVSVNDSYFKNNTFRFGILYSSIFYLESSQLSMDGTLFQNNYQHKNLGLYNVAIVDAYSSNVKINNCTFNTESHLIAPTFIFHMRLASLTEDSKNYIQINYSIFTSKGGTLRIEDIADVNIQSSFFQIDPNTDFPLEGSGLQLSGLKNLRIADSHFNSSKDAKTQVALKYQADDFQFLTSYSQFTVGNYSLKSNDKNFMKKVKDSGLITIPFEVKETHKETAYASIIPILCHESNDDDCICSYNQNSKLNIYNCSYKRLTHLPLALLNHTDWLVMEHTPVNKIDGRAYITDMIQFLDLKQSNVAVISEKILAQVNNSQKLKWMDLSGNNLDAIPQTMAQLTDLKKIWLSENPIHCDCKMTWMIGWLNNFTTFSGEHVIVDYQDVKCSSGKMKGFPIYVLTEVLMGCYPYKLTKLQKIAIGIATGIAGIIIFILVKIVIRNSRDIQFFFYYYFVWCKYFDFTQDDKAEKLDHMKYDAYLIYSNKDTRWVSHAFRRNKWKAGSRLFDLEKDHDFKLLVPQRDFAYGRTHQAQVAEGIQQSRKVIVIVSRNLLHSKKKMWNFMSIDTEALKRKNFILIVFKEKLKMSELPHELQTYYKLNLYVGPDENEDRLSAKIRFKLQCRPLMHLRPKEFPKIGDEEYAFDSDNEDTDEDIPDSHYVEDAGGEALEPGDDFPSIVVDNVEGEAQPIGVDPENISSDRDDKSLEFGNNFEQGEEENAPLLSNHFTSIN